MTLRRRFLIHLAVLHAVFAGCAVWFLRGSPVWLIVVEVFFVVSFGLGLRLLGSFFGPLALVRSGVHYMRERDFTTRLASTGQADMDQLVDVYNRMVDTLREERIRSEEQEHLLRKVVADSPGGVVTLDVDENVATVNPAACRLLDCRREDLVGRPLPEAGTPLARQLAALEPGESRLFSPSGRRRIRCRTAAFMDRGFTRRFLLIDELTEELHRSEKAAYEKLIRLMSHEVNNTSGAVQSLLNSCLTYRRQIADRDRDDFARALEVAIKRTANLDAFMRGFAEVVRLPRPRPRLTDPWNIASQAGLLFRDRCETSGVAWREEREPGLAPVSCDRVQMEQLFVNIVKNSLEALESAGGGGEIMLRGERRGRRSSLTIRDTGPGLSDEAREKIFTPFFTTRQDGQGIGLTMVREILIGHGFDFALDNHEDGGAEFTIVF